ncbi:4-hydroxy-tetrahydrodipicolinate synthase [Paenibacillus solanacearum]|uniref:4-hydroxy-tetrahydrodipicolinate synthase n=1 Tax=Paenibacillus solanacearum TaxID=2048548 RepID=A0A916NHJ9_9BACL|nr:dihydrodipicolinate synthase family protein [Paenibacillus solanacearum]CAG7610612.1 4-hydroxy-tetrahydrodipicolinate synthase [Paenibacillus solanacearum]
MDEMEDGVWPTMVTPFKESGAIDYAGLERLIAWYLDQGVDGLFAVCQSSEMFFLRLEERVELARFVKKSVDGRIPVIASGHISDRLEDQIEEIESIARTGIDAFVMVTNRLAAADEPDLVWIRHAQTLLEKLPGIRFGLYECPYPYKRLLSPELLKWCASTGRFYFLKDTSCSLSDVSAKMKAVQGSELKIFNANSATLLESLKLGVSGFSGVMSNFHPDLYAWLTKNWKQEPQKAEAVQAFLSTTALIGSQPYPANAKYHLRKEGMPIGLDCRSQDHQTLTGVHKLEVDYLHSLTRIFRDAMNL